MWMVITLLAIVFGSLLFHFLSPWWTTALASNWKQMDDTLTITLVITGIFFVVINLSSSTACCAFAIAPAGAPPTSPRTGASSAG